METVKVVVFEHPYPIEEFGKNIFCGYSLEIKELVNNCSDEETVISRMRELNI